MTVCIAAMYRHCYDFEASVYGPGVITASDRMMTLENLGIEYEPPQFKFCKVSKGCLILAADHIAVHSELLLRLRPFISDESPIEFIAQKYAELLRLYRLEIAEQAVLSRFGLTVDKFAAVQKDMDSNLIAQIDLEFKDYQAQISAQAIVAGCDTQVTHIYHVDRNGVAHLYDDIGFCCIGSGQSHANSLFTRYSYANNAPFYTALMLSYIAKKSAEVAPGVGSNTDMGVITREGAFKLNDKTFTSLEKVYGTLRVDLEKRVQDALSEFIKLDSQNIQEAQNEQEHQKVQLAAP